VAISKARAVKALLIEMSTRHPRVVHENVGDEVAARVDHGHVARRPDLARLGLTGGDHALSVFERDGYLLMVMTYSWG
jgi:hypothetical protein